MLDGQVRIPSKQPKPPANVPSTCKAGVQLQRSVDQGNGAVDVIAETSYNECSTSNDGRIIVGYLQRPVGEARPSRRFLASSLVQPYVSI